MFGGRKKTKDLQKSKSAYEYAIKRCYGSEKITLALHTFECFTGFNVKRGVVERRLHYLYNDRFIMKGVVDEHTNLDRHVPCTLAIHTDIADEALGYLALTHTGDAERTPKELQDWILQAVIYDNGGKYVDALSQYLRDAALSGKQFTHVRLMCSPPDEKELGSPTDIMRDRGYGPSRTITELHMWPSVVLPNVPIWARHKE